MRKKVMQTVSFGVRQVHQARQDVIETADRLSSGSRVSTLGKDQVAVALSSRLKSDSLGMGQAVTNIQKGMDLLVRIDDSLTEIKSIFSRGRELAVQAANETYDDTQRAQMSKEFKEILDEVTDIAIRSEYNGRFLMASNTSDSSTLVSLRVGKSGTADDTIELDLAQFGAKLQHISLSNGDHMKKVRNDGLGTAALGRQAIEQLDEAFNIISVKQTRAGALFNRLESSLNNVMEGKATTEISASRIEEVDMALEASNMVRSKMMLEGATGVMRQLNNMYSANLSILMQ
jgi:flagellin